MTNIDFKITPQMIEKGLELGYAPERLPLLFLVPLLQVAWAEGFVQASEQKAILRFAQNFKLAGHSAFERLLPWLDTRPEDEFFERSMNDLRELLDRIPAKQAEKLRAALRFGCSEVAHASGTAGFLRRGSNIHRDEREHLLKIGERLGLRHSCV
jgi:hypothetical protein